MDYTCKFCCADLDEGDILEHFLLEYGGDHIKARKTAMLYGWTDINKLHFNRSIIIQSEQLQQYIICPDCEKPIL